MTNRILELYFYLDIIEIYLNALNNYHNLHANKYRYILFLYYNQVNKNLIHKDLSILYHVQQNLYYISLINL